MLLLTVQNHVGHINKTVSPNYLIAQITRNLTWFRSPLPNDRKWLHLFPGSLKCNIKLPVRQWRNLLEQPPSSTGWLRRLSRVPVSMEVIFMTSSRLSQDYFKTTFRLIQFNWGRVSLFPPWSSYQPNQIPTWNNRPDSWLGQDYFKEASSASTQLQLNSN